MRHSRSRIHETPVRSDEPVGQKSASTQIPDPETSEFHLRSVMDTIPGVVWSAFPDGGVEFCNQRWLDYTGLSLDKVRGGELAEAIHPQDKSDFREKWRAALTEGASFEAEARMRQADGSYRWFLIRAVPLRDAKGGIIRWYGTNADIEDLKRAHRELTERERSEERLRESEARFQAMADTAPVMIWMTGTDALCNYFNKPWLEFTGRTMEQEVGTGWTQGVHPDDVQGCSDGFLPAFHARKPFRMEYRLRRADGEYRWVLESGIPRYTGAGEFAGYIGSNIDITDLKRAEEEHRAHLWFLESMDRVNRAIQGTNDLERMMGDVLDTVLAIFDCDRAWVSYPCDPDTAWWRVVMERTQPEFPGAFAFGRDLTMSPDVAEVFQAVTASNTPVRFGSGSKHPLPAETAARFSVQSMIGMAVYPKGDKPYMLGLHQCSYPRLWTAQEERLFQEIGRRLEDALTSVVMFRNLRESERKLEEAQRLTHVGYWDRDMVTDLITWSDETYRIYAVPAEERILTLDRVRELIHPEDRPMVLEAMSAALRGGPRYDVEYRVIRPSGEVRVVHSQADVTRDESGRPRRIFGTVQDISERKRAEEELRAAENRFRTYVDHATDALFVHDYERKVVDVNRQACESLGYTREELIGMMPGDFDPALGLEAAFIQPIMKERLNAGEVFSFETSHRRKDGTFFPVEVRIRPFWHGGQRFGLALVRDITERKRVEETLRQTQAELAHVARVATLGEMAASIAHEINQPLGAIVNNANACLRWLTAYNMEEVRHSAEVIRGDARRTAEIIQRIRSFAKKAPPQKDWIDLNQTMHEVIALALSELQRHNVLLGTQLSDRVPLVFADRIQLQQVILNLVMNAVEAMSEVSEGPRQLLIRTGTDEPGGIVVAVRDSGPGLRPEDIDRLFIPFYTTKLQGMGMGLAICRSIVEAHGGRLWATANEDRGATFQFTLPTGGERDASRLAE
jgi:PAS domain S-box-containing protein